MTPQILVRVVEYLGGSLTFLILLSRCAGIVRHSSITYSLILLFLFLIVFLTRLFFPARASWLQAGAIVIGGAEVLWNSHHCNVLVVFFSACLLASIVTGLKGNRSVGQLSTIVAALFTLSFGLQALEAAQNSWSWWELLQAQPWKGFLPFAATYVICYWGPQNTSPTNSIAISCLLVASSLLALHGLLGTDCFNLAFGHCSLTISKESFRKYICVEFLLLAIAWRFCFINRARALIPGRILNLLLIILSCLVLLDQWTSWRFNDFDPFIHLLEKERSSQLSLLGKALFLASFTMLLWRAGQVSIATLLCLLVVFYTSVSSVSSISLYAVLCLGILGTAGRSAGAPMVRVTYDLPKQGDVGGRSYSSSCVLLAFSSCFLGIVFVGYVFPGFFTFTPRVKYQIPGHLAGLLLVSEDHEFLLHRGISFPQIAQAIRDYVSEGKVLRGASTITMQLAKLRDFGPERTLSRKIREAIYALLYESYNSKEEILFEYLEQIDFGIESRGLLAASIHFFGKPPVELSTDESVHLVIALRNPRQFSLLAAQSAQFDREAQKLILKYRTVGPRLDLYAGLPNLVLITKEQPHDGDWHELIKSYQRVVFDVSRDGKYVALREFSEGRFDLFLLDKESGKRTSLGSSRYPPSGARFSPDGESLAVYWLEPADFIAGYISVYKPSSGKLIWRSAEREYRTGGSDFFTVLWDSDSKSIFALVRRDKLRFARFRLDSPVVDVFSACPGSPLKIVSAGNSRWIALTSIGKLFLLQPNSECQSLPLPPSGEIVDIKRSEEDGKILVASNDTVEGPSQLWELEREKYRLVCKHQLPITSIHAKSLEDFYLSLNRKGTVSPSFLCEELSPTESAMAGRDLVLRDWRDGDRGVLANSAGVSAAPQVVSYNRNKGIEEIYSQQSRFAVPVLSSYRSSATQRVSVFVTKPQNPAKKGAVVVYFRAVNFQPSSAGWSPWCGVAALRGHVCVQVNFRRQYPPSKDLTEEILHEIEKTEVIEAIHERGSTLVGESAGALVAADLSSRDLLQVKKVFLLSMPSLTLEKTLRGVPAAVPISIWNGASDPVRPELERIVNSPSFLIPERRVFLNFLNSEFHSFLLPTSWELLLRAFERDLA